MKRKLYFLIGGIIALSEISWHLYKMSRHLVKRFTEKKNILQETQFAIKKRKESFIEVIFFSQNSRLCRSHVGTANTCLKEVCPARDLRRLIEYVACAEKSLDVCMYILTCQRVGKAIVAAHERGVRVRIILDKFMAHNDASLTTVFRNNGIPLKYQDLDVIMHHKFIIIDNEILITGSANWTMSAFFGNFENVLVTNQSSLVEPFVQEFENIFNTLICANKHFNKC